MLEFEPPLVGCVVSENDFSFAALNSTRQCALNIPTVELAAQVVGCGNSSGAQVDKFARFGLTASPASLIAAPLIAECHANLECRLKDDSLVDRYNFFIFEVVKARVARTPKYPETLHYTGDGVFMVSGKIISRRAQFRPGML
jgi:flavin reductase (DIM6/NTAB) family NADH-FMN oxidoreductase RutF